MTTDSYHIDIRFQGEFPLSTAAMPTREGPSGEAPPAVRHMQRLTGAPISTARLLAELAGWALSQERAA